jgi:hypothetical protein
MRMEEVFGPVAGRLRENPVSKAPVLITGTVTFRGSEVFRLVEGVDAADYRG